MIGACCGSQLVKDVKWQKEMDRRHGPYVKRFKGGGCICNDPKGLAWMGFKVIQSYRVASCESRVSAPTAIKQFP